MEAKKQSASGGSPEQPAQTMAAAGTANIEPERAQFRSLILTNPNYFGNVKGSPFTPNFPLQENITYEEIGCLGFQPQLNELEAVVFIKRPFGYGGDLCSPGTPEYVRFYLSFDNGVTWHDQGQTSFTAHDIPGEQRLEYAVTLPVNPPKRFCFVENIIKARAILSWNNPPPPNTPNFPPVWGNVVDAHIQVDPRIFFLLSDLFTEIKAEIPHAIAPIVDLTQSLAAPEPHELSAAELYALYEKADVPIHRYLHPELQKLLAQPTLTESLMTATFPGVLSELKVDIAAIIAAIQKTSGDTRFEELDCVGLDPNLNALVGVLNVKLPTGYSGALCSAGSKEYVAFWIDWGDGAGWTYAGTTAVRVHDIASIPADGLKYAVLLPVDVNAHRKPCNKGAVTAQVRAILSWQVPPPPSNPDFVPVWGNRDETRILIAPGEPVEPGVYKLFFESVSSVPVCAINQTTGLATGDKPFGGTLTITGFILGAPDVSAAPLKYRISVRQLPGGVWQPLANTVLVNYIEQIGGGLPTQFVNVPEDVDSDGFYTYLDDPNPAGGGWRLVQNHLLGQWNTADPMTGQWEIKVQAKDPVSNTIFEAETITCPLDGTTRQHCIVLLDERAPSANIAITGFIRGGVDNPAVDCGTFQVGDIIHGTYSSVDPEAHFGSAGLSIEPFVPTNGAPVIKTVVTTSTTGETGTWSLNTGITPATATSPQKGPMDPCGYVIRLDVADRTIVSSDPSGWKNHNSVGFCLVAAPKK